MEVAKTNLRLDCPTCGNGCQRFGKHRNGLSRFRCPQCKRTYTEPHQLTLGEMFIPQEKMLLAISMLVEGNSIRSTMRITGLDQNTIMKALVLAGRTCEKVMGRLIVNVPVRDVECDEIWGFVGKKGKARRPEGRSELRGRLLFCGHRAEYELVLNFALGKRNQGDHGYFH